MPRSRRPSNPSVALVAARYELVRELSVDSETVDWEAIDTALDRTVVVQLLRPELVHDTVATERFWQVARAAARKTAIAGRRVLDGGTDPESGQLFLVRELPAAPPPVPVARTVVPLERASTKQVFGRFAPTPRWLVLGGSVVVLVLVAAAIKPGVELWLRWVNEPAVRSDPGLNLGPAVAVPTVGGTAARVAPTAPATATAVPTRAATATSVSTGQPRRIVNTDGRGVALRVAPGGDRQPGKGYDEGATVQALEQSGEWTHIRGSDGREGWVLSVTLAR
jgi:hypothetical protein